MNVLFRNCEFIKERGPKFLSDMGYVSIGFEGLEYDLLFGGFGWFQAKKEGSPFIYTIRLRKQGDSLKWLYERIINPEAASNTIKTV